MIKLAIDVELAEQDGVADVFLRRRRALERRVEVELVQAVHLREMRHGNRAARGKGGGLLPGLVPLRDVH